MVSKHRPAAVAAEAAARDRSGQIVVIESAVVESGGHIFGNLFQRLYHSIDRLRKSDEPTARELEGSARLLEDCVQLLMDYVAPCELALQELDSAEVVDSLVRQLQRTTGSSVCVDASIDDGESVVADPGRLSRAYGLLADCLRADVAPTATLRLTARVQPADALSIMISVPDGALRKRTSVAELQWAVAVRLLEIHGGALNDKGNAPGEILWELVLPLRS